MTLSILTERRVHQPYGLAGGENGQSGKNLLKLLDGRMVNLGGKCSVPMQPGVSSMKIKPQRMKSIILFRIHLFY
jgi:5-oxoprolinase (ATP-hydrolysing)